MPNLLHFLSDLGALYAARPTFMKSTPALEEKLWTVSGVLSKVKLSGNLYVFCLDNCHLQACFPPN
jgi:hypothetical protein